MKLKKNDFLTVTKSDDGNSFFDRLLGHQVVLSPKEESLLNLFKETKDYTKILSDQPFWKRWLVRKTIRHMGQLGLLFKEEQLAHYNGLPITSVDLELTSDCQAQCTICPRQTVSRGVGEMSETVFEKFIEQLKLFRPAVYLSGLGDPILHPRFFDFLKILKDNRFPTTIVTNGNGLTPPICQGIIGCRADHVIVSVMGHRAETYEKAMGIPHAETMDRVRAFVFSTRGNTPITLKMIQTAENAAEVETFQQYWRSLGVRTLVRPQQNWGGWISPSHDPQKPRRCGLFNTQIFVTYQGDILACCNDLSGEERLGNLMNDSIESILERKLRCIREERFFKMCPQCDLKMRDELIQPLGLDEP